MMEHVLKSSPKRKRSRSPEPLLPNPRRCLHRPALMRHIPGRQRSPNAPSKWDSAVGHYGARKEKVKLQR